MSRFSLLVCLCILSVGCASVNEHGQKSESGTAGNLNLIADLSVGDSLELDGASHTVVGTYRAASGRLCKRVVDASGRVKAHCRNPSGAWYTRAPLSGADDKTLPGGSLTTSAVSTGSTAATPQNRIAIVPVPTEPEVVKLSDEVSLENLDEARIFSVLSGETLWKFSRRVTGNALHWEAIARHNKLGEGAVVRTGQKLSIPAELPVAASEQ